PPHLPRPGEGSPARDWRRATSRGSARARARRPRAQSAARRPRAPRGARGGHDVRLGRDGPLQIGGASPLTLLRGLRGLLLRLRRLLRCVFLPRLRFAFRSFLLLRTRPRGQLAATLQSTRELLRPRQPHGFGGFGGERLTLGSRGSDVARHDRTGRCLERRNRGRPAFAGGGVRTWFGRRRRGSLAGRGFGAYAGVVDVEGGVLILRQERGRGQEERVVAADARIEEGRFLFGGPR